MIKSKKMKKWQTLESKIALDNKWMRIRQDKVKLPLGKTLDDYFVWQKGDSVMVIPVTKQGEFVFIKNYRQGVGDFMIEFPAGILDKGKNPLDIAEKELAEETGYRGKIKKIGKLCSEPDKITGKYNIFLALEVKPIRNFSETIKNFEENEEIEVLKIPFKQVLKKIFNGEIWATETVAAFFLASHKLGFLT